MCGPLSECIFLMSVIGLVPQTRALTHTHPLHIACDQVKLNPQIHTSVNQQRLLITFIYSVHICNGLMHAYIRSDAWGRSDL